MLIGLKGSKSQLIFFSFPSSVTMVPQYRTRPFGGTREYNLICCVFGVKDSKNKKNTNLFRQRSRYFNSSTPHFHFQQKSISKKREGTTETAVDVLVALLMIDDGEPLLY